MNIFNILTKVKYVLIIIFFTASVGFFLDSREQRSIHQEYKELYHHSSDSLKKYRDKNNQLVTSNKVLELSLSTIRETRDGKIDSLEKQVKNLKNLVSTTRFRVNASGNITGKVETVLIPGKDTTHITTPGPEEEIRKIVFDDGYLSFTQEVGEKEFTIDYSYTDQYDATIYYAREKWWKKKELVIDIKAKNPNNDITSIESIVMKKRPSFVKRVLISVFGG